MKDSSQQDPYSITLNPCDEIKLDEIVNTITLDLNSSYNYASSMADDVITITSGISDVDITTFDTQYEIDFGEEWRTHFPDFSQVEAMCKEYPALEKAFEKFKTTYEMVKDDYASKTRNNDQ